jgi:hypothetical protein
MTYLGGGNGIGDRENEIIIMYLYGTNQKYVHVCIQCFGAARSSSLLHHKPSHSIQPDTQGAKSEPNSKMTQLSLWVCCCSWLVAASTAFVVAPTTSRQISTTNTLNMMDPSSLAQAMTTAPSMILAETEAWVQPAASALDPFLNFMSFAMVS